MATVAECEQAFATLADRLAGADPAARRKNSFDRTITCRLTDLDVIFAGHLKQGRLSDIRQVQSPDAQVKLTLTSDDLVKLVNKELNMGSAWASGRVKIDARVFDLVKLRSVF